VNALSSLLAAAPAPGTADILTDLAVILCVAAVTTVVFQRIHQPVVLGYLMAGLIVGPHLPVPLFASTEVAHTLSELGVILLMFSLGLEFSLSKLIRIAPTGGVIAVIECSLMVWLGYAAGRLLGWSGYQSLFTGAVVAISSTTIVVKAFAEKGIKGPLYETVLGVLIGEDLIAILLLAVLTAIASGAGLSAGALALAVGRLAGFLVGTMAVGMLVVPRLMRFVVRLGRAETTVVASVGISFAFALIARKLGFSVALGAFLGGALVAESGESKKIEPLIEPVRDMFAAVFFVSVGMLIDPRLVLEHWGAILALTAVVVGGKVLGVTIGAFIAGNGIRTSVQAGMSLAQIGEFSFIIAGLGTSLGVVGDFLYPIAVAVSAITTLLTPWLIRAADPVGAAIEHRLPSALQTYASLYGSWVAGLRGTRSHRTAWARIRRLAALLLLDMGLIAGVVIAASLGMERVIELASAGVDLSTSVSRGLFIAAAVLLAAPFLLGAVRVARALGLALAAEALPATEKGLDLAAAPRRALLVTLQLAILLVAGAPLVAIIQPFMPSFPSAAVLLTAAAALVVPLWRSAANLQGHARAGAQVVLEALAAQGQAKRPAPEPMDEVRRLVPGLGELASMKLAPAARCVGSTLKGLELRGTTGATVLAIKRGPDQVVLPTADEVLRAGDTLVLTGTREAVAAARRLLGES
jgi:CPA2 family monovalent cation:H+ antiporter-2